MRAESSRPGLVARCVHQCRLFFVALQFYTRLPTPDWVGYAPEWLQHASRYLPAVGVVVGALTALVYALAALLWPPVVAVLLSTAAGIYLTGAFHEDGFADMCDGFGGGYTRERVLDIMKDSRIGAYGAIGIGLLIALKCAVLAAMPPAGVVAALLLAHPASRLSCAALIWRLRYARDAGKAKPLAQDMSALEFAVALGTTCLVFGLVALSGAVSASAMALGLLFGMMSTAWLARLFLRRLGGYTGDCLGAVQQAFEAAFYLGLLAVMRH